MIKFFRRIRLTLIEKNQMGKYFKYAIGEILLVVIGILIALQINNWNESRKASKLEQSYYCLLLDDIEQDKVLIKALLKNNEKRIESSHRAIAIIQSENANLDELGKETLLSRRDLLESFIPNSSTYEDIKSSGNINTLKDKQIRKSLNQYLKKVEGFNNTMLANVTLITDRLTKFEDWFSNGVVHSSYKEIFPKEIQDQLSRDLPDNIRDEIKSRLYEDLVIEGIMLRRRSELFETMEDEVDIMKSKLTKRCKIKNKLN
ncbi:Hypothetical protein I595_1363 [Croceitalea dokdonensis DOKDO 023]|uniref:Uncharacterized protein n=2 Tax=Croceitalea TaxID=574891 RepID=A0A0P7B388_9FLAO|nr:Hypothetical protein I595_1363 [Croceitalea dokdonensis DOKDO 023]